MYGVFLVGLIGAIAAWIIWHSRRTTKRPPEPLWPTNLKLACAMFGLGVFCLSFRNHPYIIPHLNIPDYEFYFGLTVFLICAAGFHYLRERPRKP